MIGVLKAHKSLENIASRHTDLLQVQITKDFAEMDRLEKEKAEKIAELATTSFGAQLWNKAATAAQYVVSGASLVVGSCALLQQGYNAAHMVLVASGISGLAYRILQDTGLLKIITAQFAKSQEAQDKVARYLDMGNLCLSLGLGLAGGLWAHQAGSALLGTAFKTLSLGSLFLQGVKLGQGLIQFKVSLLQKDEAQIIGLIQRMQSQISQVFQRMKDNCKNAEHIIQTSGQVNETMQQTIASLHTRSFS